MNILLSLPEIGIFGWIFVICVIWGVLFPIARIIFNSYKHKEHSNTDSNDVESNDNGKFKNVAIKMLNRDGDVSDDEWHTYIAGLRYHISQSDIGGFMGFVANDADNKVNPDAMGIYNYEGKLLGFIPEKYLDEYRFWSNAEPKPCVGFIFIDDGMIKGRAKILQPCNKEFLSTEFSKYLTWVNNHMGPEYLPKNLEMKFDVENYYPQNDPFNKNTDMTKLTSAEKKILSTAWSTVSMPGFMIIPLLQ